jgi:hypothetical protein
MQLVALQIDRCATQGCFALTTLKPEVGGNAELPKERSAVSRQFHYDAPDYKSIEKKRHLRRVLPSQT